MLTKSRRVLSVTIRSTFSGSPSRATTFWTWACPVGVVVAEGAAGGRERRRPGGAGAGVADESRRVTPCLPVGPKRAGTVARGRQIQAAEPSGTTIELSEMVEFGVALALMGAALLVAEAHAPGGVLGVAGGATWRAARRSRWRAPAAALAS